MAEIIDGKKTAQSIKDELRARTEELRKQGREATLAVVLVGRDLASAGYVRNKKKACEYCGIRSLSYELPETTSEQELLSLIAGLNADPAVNGILVQLPLPLHMNAQKVIEAISPAKDVDGFHPQSVGALSIGLPGYRSCTPAGIIELLRRYHIAMAGKECVIVGRSNIVGKPMAMLMLREDATVTIAHSKTADLAAVTRRADILIVAVGKAGLIEKKHVKPGAVVIDCGMNRDPDGTLCGDVNFAEVEELCSAITPVPGGVGPMTIAMLMSNCLDSLALQRH
ncbi:bifunctional methylenetetrahydrofolate dehydrogenase/methenyltetrahydrofolate cyclohydrolase FolD [Lachnoclostridium sp. Marseille-P6806]|uniref:bifunctional methylenetetrahydrofolate dehydrogenase/methenyltetrahydrofolate cyclohydrolase FolD n=1 Tax=Lachnoclostridium sp. Marseille-P6806 TaxID=2364793 RepID=UPI00102F4B72|nr:bifunctional methylenetetrahydrofolate dehydrogenase/methenyltetrahydrofolate cyclohydrolase FolD [Lachnoclostridium sp. Marseille-P6806]